MMSVFCDHAPLAIKIEYAFRIYGTVQSADLEQKFGSNNAINFVKYYNNYNSFGLSVDQSEVEQDCVIKTF